MCTIDTIQQLLLLYVPLSVDELCTILESNDDIFELLLICKLPFFNCRIVFPINRSTIIR